MTLKGVVEAEPRVSPLDEASCPVHAPKVALPSVRRGQAALVRRAGHDLVADGVAAVLAEEAAAKVHLAHEGRREARAPKEVPYRQLRRLHLRAQADGPSAEECAPALRQVARED